MILIKNIEGEVFANNTGDVILIKSVVGNVQREDYIKMGGFIAYLQNLTNVEKTEVGITPLNMGLSNSLNIPVVVLEIDYKNNLSTAPIILLI